jgi:regulator of G-protein signaling
MPNLICREHFDTFQIRYYWPSQNHTPDNIEYAIYLAKRSMKKTQKHALEDYEADAFANLKKILANKWDFVLMQAEEQLKLGKDRKRGDKIITESQEKAYWRVYRPPPGFTTVVDTCPVPTREQRVKARSRTREHLTEEVEFLRNYCLMSRCKVSQVAESLIEYTEDFYEFDAILNGNSVGPSNPWITDDQSYWALTQPM